MTAKHHPDYRFLIAAGLLLVFGLAMLSSASSVVGFERFQDSYYFLKRQLVATGLGLVLFIGLSKFDYRQLKRLALPIIIASIFLLVLIFIPHIGESYGTFARRWVRVGWFSFQPSEVAKLFFVIYLAAWLAGRAKKMGDFKLTFLPFAAVLALVSGLVVAQPDIGTAFIIVLTGIGMYFTAGGRGWHLLFLIAIGATAFFLLIIYSPHASDRFKIFLHPELDPKGIGYHINQAYLAIGSGGITGQGFGQSRAKFQYLPEVYGDSIFAVVAEELGFVAAVALLALLLYIFFRGLKISKSAPDDFGRLLGLGIILWLTGQTAVNISAMVGLLPLTGIPLPLISYGSSAMVMILAAVGIMANISTRSGQQ